MSQVPRQFALVCGLLLLALSLAACSPGGVFSGDMMWAPHGPQETGAAVTRSALNALSEGDRAGQITLTESEFASLLRAALVRDSGEDGVVRDVQVWFEPDTIYLKVLLRQGVVPGIPTDVAINLEGDLRVEDGRLRFGLNRAGMGVIPLLSQPVLSLIEEQLDLSVDQIVNRATPLDIKLDTGQITITLP